MINKCWLDAEHPPLYTCVLVKRQQLPQHICIKYKYCTLP